MANACYAKAITPAIIDHSKRSRWPMCLALKPAIVLENLLLSLEGRLMGAAHPFFHLHKPSGISKNSQRAAEG
jgi:hypothetical protein